MSATGTSRSIGEQKAELNLDRNWARDLTGRWEVAEEYVRFLDVELLPVGHALRQVIGDDFPKMMRELTRLRPDLL
jgi:hypothetical protein